MAKGTKKKIKVKWIVIGAIAVLAAALLLLPKLLGGSAGASLSMSDTALVVRTDIESTVSASGTVESANATNVYSTLPYPVMAVHVEVGDSVREGDLLCELDPESISDQITSTKLSLDTAQQSGSLSRKNASDNYNNYKSGIEDGLNTSLLTAQSQLDSAKLAYDNAVKTYDRFVTAYDKGENTTLLSAESALTQADNAVSAAEYALEQAEKAGVEDTTALHNQLVSATDSYNMAKKSYDAAKTAVENAIEDYKTAVDNAADTYEKAKKTFEATQKSVNEQLSGLSTAVSSASVTTSTASTEEALAQLEKTLADTRITAPCDGTVTAVYATVGASGSGLLFVIEDVDELIVKTTVKGYDMGAVQVGQNVRIGSEATGNAVFDGVISKIAPTARKNAYGKTDAAADTLFDAEVEITSKDTGLRIGMEAQLDYILEQQSDVLTISYDAIYQNENGESCVIVVDEPSEGRFTLREVRVETGMDDDLDIVISGEGITEGTRIVTAPERYRGLIGQTLAKGSEYMSEMQRMMG